MAGSKKEFGIRGLVVDSVGELTQTRTGLWTGSVRFSLPTNQLNLIRPAILKHPFATFMKAEMVRVSLGAGLWRASVDFVGIEEDSSDDQIVYELSQGTGQEDIQTHPMFVQAIGGKASAPLNGALFVDGSGVESSDDTVGVFSKFRLIIDGEQNPYAGLTAYIVANQTTWKKSWVQKDPPSPGGVRIENNPPGDAPNFGGKSTWLELPVSYQKRGDVYTCSQVWQASGPKGINSVVYEYE